MALFLAIFARLAGAGSPDRDTGIAPDSVEEVAPAAPIAPAAEPEAAPIAPAAEPEVAPVEAPPPGDRRADAEARYLAALESWNERDWRAAHRAATEALALDPDLAAARLLAGYALLRLRRWDEARVTIDGLTPEVGAPTLPSASVATARRLLRRGVAPFRRDQWAISMGHVSWVERAYAGGWGQAGFLLQARAPVLPGLAVRVDGGLPWTAAELSEVRGVRLGVSAVAPRPLGNGRFHLDLLAGPVLWLASGRYWSDGQQPYLGARTAVALDVRTGPAIGFFAEVGASVFPALTTDLPFYAAPIDVRLGLSTWFGR